MSYVGDDEEFTYDDFPDELAVLWQPEGFWVLGDFFTIQYVEYGNPDNWQQLTIWDYHIDGVLKPLEDLLASTDNPAGLQRFLNVGAYLEFRNGSVRLVLSDDFEDMPRAIIVQVKFEPTLAVNNVTQDNAGGRVMVMRNGSGNLNNDSDGVPDLGGTPYRATEVYGVADEGFEVDMTYVLVRNLNDNGGVIGDPVFLEPDENGVFSATMQTIIADRVYTVEKTGRITIASIHIEFDGLPVPLQVDLRFIPIDDSTGTGTDRPREAALPRTGVETPIAMLLICLLTSLTATFAVVMAIRYQNRKERRG